MVSAKCARECAVENESHQAREDILDSIAEARYYKKIFNTSNSGINSGEKDSVQSILLKPACRNH
jgi:hypothetical protein